MPEITVSKQHQQAVELHQRILTSANLAQQNLWDMCTDILMCYKKYKECKNNEIRNY